MLWVANLTGEYSPRALQRSTCWACPPRSQVPGRWVYLCDGPNREYAIGKTLLVFKQTALKEVGFKHPKSGLLVRALKAMGQERVDTAVMQAIRAWLSDKDRDRIPRDTRQITGWVTRTLARPFEGGSVIKLIEHAYNTQKLR